MPSAAGLEKRARKQKYREQLLENFNTHKAVLIITVDNVGSNQMQQVRIALRGKAIVLMGKNTVMRRAIRDEAANNPNLAAILPSIQGNMGFVFTNHDLLEIRDIISANTVPAAARGGQIAPLDVFVPAGPTGLDPGQTNFFQALNIATKIARGTIEILNDVHLIKAGERVTSSAVIMLNKVNLRPFSYRIEVINVYEEGSVYAAKFLDMTIAEIGVRFSAGCGTLAALSFAINYPNLTTLPHSIGRAIKVLVALSLATDYGIEEAKEYKELLDNPELLAAKQAAAAAAGGGDGAAAGGDDAAAAAEEEDDEDEEPAGGMDMFGGDDDGEAADY